MTKYFCYEKETENYICTLYSFTDVLNLRLFLQEKKTDLIALPRKMDKKTVRKVFTEGIDKSFRSLDISE